MNTNKLLDHKPKPASYLSYGALQTSFQFECVVCKSSFTANSGHALTCKRECRLEHRRRVAKKWRSRPANKLKLKLRQRAAREKVK